MFRVAVAALAAVSLAAEARAADMEESFLRGTFLPEYVNWSGYNFGVHYAMTSAHSDFGNATGNQVAYLLRNTTLENESQPSTWTALPATDATGRGWGAFLGYTTQSDKLILGLDLTYTSLKLTNTASDAMRRITSTSDGLSNDVTIAALSSMTLRDYGTVRGRIGYALGQFAPYATLGVAAGRVSYTTSSTVTAIGTVNTGGTPYNYGPVTATEGKDNTFVAGFTAGLGLDVAILPNIFLRAEWEFIAFSPVNKIRTTVNAGKIGIGMKF